MAAQHCSTNQGPLHIQAHVDFHKFFSYVQLSNYARLEHSCCLWVHPCRIVIRNRLLHIFVDKNLPLAEADDDALQLAHLRGVLSYMLASVAACLSIDLVATISCLSRKIPDTLQVICSYGLGEIPELG